MPRLQVDKWDLVNTRYNELYQAAMEGAPSGLRSADILMIQADALRIAIDEVFGTQVDMNVSVGRKGVRIEGFIRGALK